MPNFAEEIVDTRKFFCEGDSKNGEPGHPGIYLIIPQSDNSIVCPYCSKKFIFKKTHD